MTNEKRELAPAEGREPKPLERPPQKAPRAEESITVERRAFLRNAMWGGIGLWTAGSLLGAGAMFWPTKVTGFGAKVEAGNLSDFPPGSMTQVREGKFYLSRLENGNLMALYWKCVHLGCTVPWVARDGLFKCPCHGSWYEATGQNIAGPAPRPLDYMELEVVDGKVIVDTGKIHKRTTHLPEHEYKV